MNTYALTKLPTPVLNTCHFRTCFSGKALPLDAQQLLRPVETVLFPNTKLQLMERFEHSIWRIQTQEYPATYPLYIDERFLTIVSHEPAERKPCMPSASALLSILEQQLGTRYIWGGNWPAGIPQLFKWYPPSMKAALLDPLTRDTWQLKGVDCSGLLYYAANGSTPRNTAELVSFGNIVRIAGKSLCKIMELLLPLDMIVWHGHVLFVFDQHSVIESKGGAGVVLTSLPLRLQEIMQARKPLDAYSVEEPSFVIRRWHPECLYHSRKIKSHFSCVKAAEFPRSQLA